ncbi:LemA protein [hydrothermal vent metagenome]|uniref:LemA protein n=1 Tax=hydrothermal vent metagenome TaxID=652676 RepID=A0A3B0V0K7_9ZZZZ
MSTSYLVIRPLSEDPSMIEPLIKEISVLTGLDRSAIIQRTTGTTLKILKTGRAEDKEKLTAMAAQLRRIGMPAVVIDKDEVRAEKRPVRITAVVPGSKALRLTSQNGKEAVNIMSAPIIALVLLGLLLLTIFIYFTTIYNGLVTVKNNVDKYWSDIDVLLKQRFDELPKLIKVCEGYMQHEAETLERVIKARSMMSGAGTMQEKGQAEGMLTEALKSLFAVTENYPELKADRSFGQLQARITELEDEISDRRELYNDSVNIYNIRIEKLPDTFVAGIFNYRTKELWRIEDPGHRRDVVVEFKRRETRAG